MSDTLTTIIVAVLGSGALSTLISHGVSQRSARRQTHTSQDEMLLGLAHDRIYALCKTYLARGAISVGELDNLTYLYTPYRKLDGNGTGEHLYNAVLKLPVITDEELEHWDK